MKNFIKGDRVKLGGDWALHCMYNPPKTTPVGRQAIVIGNSRTSECTRIVFDGSVTPQTFHNSFLERV